MRRSLGSVSEPKSVNSPQRRTGTSRAGAGAALGVAGVVMRTKPFFGAADTFRSRKIGVLYVARVPLASLIVACVAESTLMTVAASSRPLGGGGISESDVMSSPFARSPENMTRCTTSPAFRLGGRETIEEGVTVNVSNVECSLTTTCESEEA